MARFLSEAWFGEVLSHERSAKPIDDRQDRIVIERLVISSPYGRVRYRVAVCAGVAAVVPPGSAADQTGSELVDITITSDWATACDLAKGTLSTEAAVLEGRLRVKGDVSRLGALAGERADLDALPVEVRARTTY